LFSQIAVQILAYFRWLLRLGGDELLSAVDVVSCTCEGSINHDVYGERGHICRLNDTPDGKGSAKLVAPVFKFITE
jgi:hypothetical protein